jgi:hypothetical protein
VQEDDADDHAVRHADADAVPHEAAAEPPWPGRRRARRVAGIGQPSAAGRRASAAAGRQHLATAWWIAIFPGLAIMVVVQCFNVLGDWLRDALDPTLDA